MKRNWDVIREVLIEVEALDQSKHQTIDYCPACGDGDPSKAMHAILLWRAGFVRGVDASNVSGAAVMADALTWQGYDLLETMRSKDLWERIKATAREKGLELTFDTLKAIHKVALGAILSA